MGGTRKGKTVKLMKWSHSFNVCWWDKNFFEDSAYPDGLVALVNQVNPKPLKNLNHHYYKAVDSFREWTLPKKVTPVPALNPKPTKKPIHTFESLIVTTTTKAPVAPTAVPMKQLHCDTEELKQFCFRVGNCKFAGAYRHLKPVNSNSNQGLLNGQVLNGAQCKMSCDDFRKKPFMNPKMQCLCKSHLRAKFQIFATLNDIISQTNPMNFINKKQCNWYDRTKKNSSPVEPMSVFPRLKFGMKSI